MDFAKRKLADDSGVSFRIGDEFLFGLIRSIFVNHDNNFYMQMWPLSDAIPLTIDCKDQKIQLSMIQEGTLLDDRNNYYIPAENIIEKCLHWTNKQTKKTIFFRFPNLDNCS